MTDTIIHAYEGSVVNVYMQAQTVELLDPTNDEGIIRPGLDLESDRDIEH